MGWALSGIEAVSLPAQNTIYPSQQICHPYNRQVVPGVVPEVLAALHRVGAGWDEAMKVM